MSQLASALISVVGCVGSFLVLKNTPAACIFGFLFIVNVVTWVLDRGKNVDSHP